MRRWLKFLLISAVVVVLGLATLVWYVAKPPTTPEFYSAPAKVSERALGTVLRSERVKPSVPGADVWRILYVTNDKESHRVAVSALVAAPHGPVPDVGFPLVAVAHGTLGINRGCAPSINPSKKADQDSTTYEFLVGQYVDAGYAVVMTDFEGLGVKGRNTFLVSEVEGRNVLDSIRAIKDFDKVSVQDSALIAGHSQGGHAVLFAAQIAPTYAPELKLDGVVAQAPATDLGGMFSAITTADKRGGIVSLPVMAADAYNQNYPDLDIKKVLTDRGEVALKTVVRKTCPLPSVLGTALAKPSDLFRADGLEVLAPEIQLNTPGTDFTMPIFMAQGEIDNVVPLATNTTYAKTLCGTRQNLTFHTYPGVGHAEVVAASTPEALAWMKAVRAGATPKSTC